MQKNTISEWFYDKIWLPRLAWSIAFQSVGTFFTTLVALSLLNLDLWHPFASFYAAVTVPFSWRCLLVSCVCAISVLPLSFTAGQLLTVRNERLCDQWAKGGWRFAAYMSLGTVLPALVEVVIAVCCLNMSYIQPEAQSIIIYGVTLVSWASIAVYILRRRNRIQFRDDLDYNTYKKLLLFIYETCYRSEIANMARFVGYGFGLFLGTFLTFGWRINRTLVGNPATFMDALWNGVICQPSIAWAFIILSAAVICRQNLMVVLFHIIICKVRTSPSFLPPAL